MTRVTIFAVVIITAIAVPALAGTPPIESKRTPADIAAACVELGSKGEAIAIGSMTGCRNIETGAIAACDENGQCKNYFADPRDAKIRAILDNARKQQAPI